MAKLLPAMAVVLMLGACEPQDRRPGLWLSGELQPNPDDWSFTDEINEIFVQVASPYFLPHSVTIICASYEGELYIGANRPETKNWPAWVAEDPNVVLKVGENLYEGTLNRVADPLMIANILETLANKYQVGGSTPTNVWFWRVDPRT